jgi:hypothetical protein
MPCAGVQFDPVCPPLGATILQQQAAAVDAYQVFSLPVSVLDAFGSLVSSGPGSSWLARLDQTLNPKSDQNLNPEQPQQQQQGGGSSSGASQLAGDRRVRLIGGSAVFAGLSLAAAPGSLVNLTLTAAAGSNRAQVGCAAVLCCVACVGWVVACCCSWQFGQPYFDCCSRQQQSTGRVLLLLCTVL